MFVDALRYTRAPKYAILAAILLVPLLVLVGQQTTPVVIDGPQGQAKVIQVQGKNYVEVDEVAHHGRVSAFRRTSDRPDVATEGSAQAVHSTPAIGYSRQFVSAGIETMREILEWHAALKTAIDRGYPLSDDLFGPIRRQVQASLKHNEADASTELDQRALPLLINESKNMTALTDKYLRMTVNRDYVAPNSLGSEPLEQKLMSCWRSLAWMASSNQFVDDGSCQE
jgi:hypothetical protein